MSSSRPAARQLFPSRPTSQNNMNRLRPVLSDVAWLLLIVWALPLAILVLGLPIVGVIAFVRRYSSCCEEVRTPALDSYRLPVALTTSALMRSPRRRRVHASSTRARPRH